MDAQDAWAATHVAAALVALATGLLVLLAPKGTRAPRARGTVYALALLGVNVAALALYRDGTFGVFHGLAVASLLTLAVGLVPLLRGSRTDAALANHAYCMTWSYAGLVAAGCGQLTAAMSDESSGWVVPASIGAALLLGGVVIFARVPRALRAVT